MKLFRTFRQMNRHLSSVFLSRQPCISKSELIHCVPLRLPPYQSFQTRQGSHAEEAEKAENSIYSKHPWRDQITMLEELLKVSRGTAIKILTRHPEILSCDREHVMNRLDKLQKKSIRSNRIVDMPWLLYMTDDKLIEITNILRKGLGGLKFEVAVAFGQFRVQIVRELVIAWKMDDRLVLTRMGSSHEHRIQYLASALECHQVNVADMIAKVRPIATMPFSRLHHVTEIMLDHGISTPSLITDPKVIACVPENIEQRLQVLKQHNIRNWPSRLLRQRWSLFLREVESGTPDMYVPMTDEDDEDELELSQYEKAFRKVYNVSVEEARKLTAKGPKLVMLYDTLHERLQTLKSKGYTFDDILEAPRILLRSSYTIEKRYDEIQSLGQLKPPLKLLQEHTYEYNYKKKRINSGGS